MRLFGWGKEKLEELFRDWKEEEDGEGIVE